MKFLIRIGSDLRVITMWHCSDGNIYIDQVWVEEVSDTVTGSTVELEAVLKVYCKENGYKFIGSLAESVIVRGT